MLDQQVPYANLAFLRSAVTLGDILFQLLCVCSWRGFPLGGFLGFVEIIREVFRLRVTNFPASWQAYISLVRLPLALSRKNLLLGDNQTK